MRRRKQNGSIIKNSETLRDVAFRAIGHPVHRAILVALVDGPKTISELASELREDAGYLVSPLRALKLGYLIETSREGRRTRYRIEAETVDVLIDFLKALRVEPVAAAESARYVLGSAVVSLPRVETSCSGAVLMGPR
ncbi:MAG TPA: winged helix-turn-helix domain-containing protein [Fimbriimonadaceae bacterium]|nr:winged helix-turn-helix domain-containing protein [Fimbriimonadaceae bacterium]